MKRALIFTALTLLSSITCVAQGWKSGNELLAECKGDVIERGLCIAYITGVDDGLNVATNFNPATEFDPATGVYRSTIFEDIGRSLHPVQFYCIPKGVILRQLVDIVVKHLEDHPSVRHEAAGMLVSAALATAYPCPKRSTEK